MTPEQMKREIEGIITSAKIADATQKAGARALVVIDTRTRRGEFLGGARKDEGYSDRPLPMNRAVNPSYRPGEGWFTGSIPISNDEIDWHTRKDGRRVARLRGGYKRLREIWGRQTGKVDLTFTGTMLRSLFYQIIETPDGMQAVVTVSPDQMNKALGTNYSREWLALDDGEIDEITGLVAGSF